MPSPSPSTGFKARRTRAQYSNGGRGITGPAGQATRGSMSPFAPWPGLLPPPQRVREPIGDLFRDPISRRSFTAASSASGTRSTIARVVRQPIEPRKRRHSDAHLRCRLRAGSVSRQPGQVKISGAIKDTICIARWVSLRSGRATGARENPPLLVWHATTSDSASDGCRTGRLSNAQHCAPRADHLQVLHH